LHQKDVGKTELELQVVERIAEQSHDIKLRVRLIKGALELLLEKANVDNNEVGKPEGNVNEICIPCEDEAKQQSTIAGAD
jgi:4-diphosphocytidyl-2C-methyl-D-erythritol kinase